MIHPEDYDAMVKLFRGKEPPDDVVDEYEVQRRMASMYGHNGPLGMYLVIPMLRQLGYGKVVERPVKHIEWREHIGDEVVVAYGDQKVPGRLVSLATNHYLRVATDQYGEIELPRYAVELPPTKELLTERDAWARVKRGVRVVVKTDGEPLVGKFMGRNSDGVCVKVGTESRTYPPEFVELTA